MVGMPVIAPLVALKDRPAGKVAGLIANAFAEDPLWRTGVMLTVDPTVTVADEGL